MDPVSSGKGPTLFTELHYQEHAGLRRCFVLRFSLFSLLLSIINIVMLVYGFSEAMLVPSGVCLVHWRYYFNRIAWFFFSVSSSLGLIIGLIYVFVVDDKPSDKKTQ